MTQLLLILGSIIILILGISCFFINAIGGCIGISIKVFFETILAPLGYSRKTPTGSWD